MLNIENCENLEYRAQKLCRFPNVLHLIVEWETVHLHVVESCFNVELLFLIL